jgi:hypothetical protein
VDLRVFSRDGKILVQQPDGSFKEEEKKQILDLGYRDTASRDYSWLYPLLGIIALLGVLAGRFLS